MTYTRDLLIMSSKHEHKKILYFDKVLEILIKEIERERLLKYIILLSFTFSELYL